MSHYALVQLRHLCKIQRLLNFNRKLKPFLSWGKAEEAIKQSEDVDKSRYKQENPMLNEQSLKTLFMAEFRGDGNNPVVYNRYMNPFGHLTANPSPY